MAVLTHNIPNIQQMLQRLTERLLDSHDNPEGYKKAKRWGVTI